VCCCSCSWRTTSKTRRVSSRSSASADCSTGYARECVPILLATGSPGVMP
jgi:hypothetical protein